MGCLYKLTSPSGKSYIGISSKTMDARWHKHIEHAMGKRDAGALYNALRKYGPENFIREQLVECDDWETLCQMEIEAIQTHNTFSPSGYNITLGGEGTLGPISDEARVRVSIAQKKRFQRPEELAKAQAALAKGRESSSKKHAANRINGRAPWEHRRYMKSLQAQNSKLLRKKTGIVKTKHITVKKLTIKKIITHTPKPPRSLEWREKISKSKIGHLYGKRSSEFVAKQVAGIQAAWDDPVKKAKRLEKNAIARKKSYPGVDLVCGNCGKTFNVPTWRAKPPTPKNCSRACYFESKKKP